MKKWIKDIYLYIQKNKVDINKLYIRLSTYPITSIYCEYIDDKYINNFKNDIKIKLKKIFEDSKIYYI